MGIRPKRKLKQMHWDKIDLVDHTIWAATMDDKSMAADLFKKGVFEEVERIFAAKDIKLVAAKKKLKLEETSFLTKDVSQQFGINLHMFINDSVPELVEKVLSCHPDVIQNSNVLEFLSKPELTDVTINLAKNLQPYGTSWTLDKFEEPEKDPNELARADQIYLELCYNLQHYWKSRMRAIYVMSTYRKDYTDLVTKLRALDAACECVRNSKHFPKLLEIILTVGNFMNDSSKQASGFRLGTLQRLPFTKNDNNTMTFLHYVESVVRKSYPEAADFTEELKGACNVAKLSVDQLKSDCNELIQSIKNCQTSVDIGNLSNPSKLHPRDKVLSYVLTGLPEARRKRENLIDQLKTTMNEFNKLMKFFGEDPTDSNACLTFFSKFATFIAEYKKARAENLQRELDNRAYEARKKLMEMPKKAEQLEAGGLGPSSSGTATKPNAVMDTLLERLRAAGPSSSARSARRRAAARKTVADQRRILSQPQDTNSSPDNVTKHQRKKSHKLSLIEIPEPLLKSQQTIVEDGEEQVVASPQSAMSGDNASAPSPQSPSSPLAARTKTTTLQVDEAGLGAPSPTSQSSPISDLEDVGGRARQLLLELRNGGNSNGSNGSNGDSSHHGHSPSNSTFRESNSRLAEKRARHANRRAKGETLIQSGSSAHSPSTEGGLPSPTSPGTSDPAEREIIATSPTPTAKGKKMNLPPVALVGSDEDESFHSDEVEVAATSNA